MKQQLSFLSMLAAAAVSCNAPTKNSSNAVEPMVEVQTVSAMKKVMMGEDLSAHVSWDTIPQEHLFALAPLGRIEGEITVLDGMMYASTVDTTNNVAITHDWNIHSPFAVMCRVEAWEAYETEVSISDEDDLQDLIETVAKKNGYDTDQAFPFRVIGNFETVDYHIISKPADEAEHDHELHNKAKKHFSVQQVQGQLLGFYSQHHMGVFTHRGHFIHTHFLDDAIKNTGHLESLSVHSTVKILLPKIK